MVVDVTISVHSNDLFIFLEEFSMYIVKESRLIWTRNMRQLKIEIRLKSSPMDVIDRITMISNEMSIECLNQRLTEDHLIFLQFVDIGLRQSIEHFVGFDRHTAMIVNETINGLTRPGKHS